jgi:hypothetical protein
MGNTDPNNLHRLIKLALDSGEAETIDEARRLFSQYQLRLHLGYGWESSRAGQAAVATILNTAMRAFLGGVVVSGEIDGRFDIALYQGLTAGRVASNFGAAIIPVDVRTPTLVVGEADLAENSPFCIRAEFNGWQAGISPVSAGRALETRLDNPLAGVAAGSLAVSEAFLHVRRELPIAGNRVTGMSLWNPGEVDRWSDAENEGPELSLLPKSLWLIGLGHLGQAYAWTLSMLPYARPEDVNLFLQDTDFITDSSLSTCLFADAGVLGQRKTRVLANKLQSMGFTTNLIERLFDTGQKRQVDEPRVALFGVDNIAARRAIGSAGFDLTVEAGLGSGYRDFRNIRLHTFPGPRDAANIWATDTATQQTPQLAPAYERMLQNGSDQCGVTMLASRAVGTPFVGAFAAAVGLAEIVRPLHGGKRLATVDVSMRDFRHRTVVANGSSSPRNLGYTEASQLSSARVALRSLSMPLVE